MTHHRWSGWPGAFCLKCGAPDLLEQAIADDVFDPFTGTWDTKEHEQEYAQPACPVSDAEYRVFMKDKHGIDIP